MGNIKFSLGIYNKRFNCHGPDNKNQKCPPNPSLPKNSILMPNPPNISTKTRQAAAIRIQSQGGGRMRLGGIKGGGIPPSTPATTTTPAFNCAPAPPYPMACIKPPRNTF